MPYIAWCNLGLWKGLPVSTLASLLKIGDEFSNLLVGFEHAQSQS